MDRFIIISGCSGGGKSSLIAALGARGFATIAEPGRRIVAQEQAGDGAALPWANPIAFARCAIAMAQNDVQKAENQSGWVFFDRGLIDALVALRHAQGKFLAPNAPQQRFHNRVFLTPPWPEIYVKDPERQHDFDTARAEYQRLSAAYPAMGYTIDILPKISVSARVAYVLEKLGSTSS